MKRALTLRARLPQVLRLALACTSLCSVGWACGGHSRDPEDPSGVAQLQSQVPWQEKTRQQRVDWMAVSVHPKMRAVFAKFDADRFQDFTCQTCHGETMELADYHMPNTLYALSPTDTVAKAAAYDPKVAEFMIRDVMPEMAKLLGESPYDPATHAGFSCFGCHPAER